MGCTISEKNIGSVAERNFIFTKANYIVFSLQAICILRLIWCFSKTGAFPKTAIFYSNTLYMWKWIDSQDRDRVLEFKKFITGFTSVVYYVQDLANRQERMMLMQHSWPWFFFRSRKTCINIASVKNAIRGFNMRVRAWIASWWEEQQCR